MRNDLRIRDGLRGGTPDNARTRALEKRHHGWVYLISDGGWSVKIGYATNPEKRLALLQTGNVERLRLVGVIEGPRELERDLNALFGVYRHHGEWFSDHRDIRDYFADNGFVCSCPGRRIDAECFIHGEGLPAWGRAAVPSRESRDTA